MRLASLVQITFAFLCCCFCACGNSEQVVVEKAAKPVATVGKLETADKAGKKEAPKFAPLGGPKKKKAAKFALKNTTPFAAADNSRPEEVKRLIGRYHDLAIRYIEDMARATDEEKATVALRQPSVKSLRPFSTLLAHLIADNPKDEPSLDAMVFLSKFIGVPEIDAALEKVAMEVGDDEPADLNVRSLLLKHHAHNKKIVDAFQRMPRGDATDKFLGEVFETSFNPQVRWYSAAQLISSLRRNDRSDEILPIAKAMSEDRYLEGVPAGSTNARDWAIAKVREIQLLGVGNPLPEVSGTTLDGEIANISDYRGKVVVLDAWATWCGPCVNMIPHQTEMVEAFKDKPFAILSVSCDSEKETLEEFLKKTPMPWDHWWVGPESEFIRALNIRAYPSIYVVDAKGVIRYKNVDGEELEHAINSLLDEMTAE